MNSGKTSAASSEKQGLSELRKQIALFPGKPGVYLMKGVEGEVIYVGKAASLYDRVRSYLNGGDERPQIEFLMRRVQSIEIIVTYNEEQALILESDLIKKFKPRYNVRLKDDKAFLSIRINKEDPWPRIELVRKVEQDGATYYGPYPYATELRNLLEVIKSVTMLRSCTDTIFHNRQRPCLEYEIKRCAGPCCLAVDRNDYQRWLLQAEKILQGKTSTVIKELNQEMERCSAELNFEEAAKLRDRIAFLERYSAGQDLLSRTGEDRDVFFLYREGELAALSVILVRSGRVGNSKNFAFKNISSFDTEIMESVVFQFYEAGNEIPPEVVLPLQFEGIDLLKKVLSQRAGSNVEITAAQRGVKARLLKIAELNAKQYFIQQFNADERNSQIAQGITKQFALKQVPRRVECIDISNLQGSDIVASVVSFFDGMPDKERYRRYKLSIQGKPDDFACIHEVTTRRLKRGIMHEDLPDLLIIDGGAGQLSAALAARDQLGLVVEIIALAKQRSESRSKGREEQPERVFIAGQNTAIPLEPDNIITHFFQRIRDEAHRFAISFHRAQRSKRVFKSVLDQISGLGPERRRRLLKYYGSVGKMKNVAVEEIAKIGRMPRALAEKVVKTIAE